MLVFLIKAIIIWCTIGCIVQIFIQEDTVSEAIKARENIIKEGKLNIDKLPPINPKTVGLFLILLWPLIFLPGGR